MGSLESLASELLRALFVIGNFDCRNCVPESFDSEVVLNGLKLLPPSPSHCISFTGREEKTPPGPSFDGVSIALCGCKGKSLVVSFSSLSTPWFSSSIAFLSSLARTILNGFGWFRIAFVAEWWFACLLVLGFHWLIVVWCDGGPAGGVDSFDSKIDSFDSSLQLVPMCLDRM